MTEWVNSFLGNSTRNRSGCPEHDTVPKVRQAFLPAGADRNVRATLSSVCNGKWFRIRLRSAGALAVLCLAELAAAADDGTGVVRRLRLGYSLRNTRSAPAPIAELLVRMPLTRTPWQTCDAPTATRAFERQCGADGGHLLRFAFTNLPPFACESIWVDVDVRMRETPGADSGADGAAWLAAAAPFDFRDPAFAAVLRTLGGGPGRQTGELGGMIARYAGERVHGGGFSGGQRPALEVLRDGRGDCSERMALVVALCRRAGIAARGVGGVCTPRDRVVRAADFHDWAVYREGAHWRLSDPGARPAAATDYVAFQWIDGGPADGVAVRRYRAAGDGVEARME